MISILLLARPLLAQKCQFPQRAYIRTLKGIAAEDELTQAVDAIPLSPVNLTYNQSGLLFKVTNLRPLAEYIEDQHKAEYFPFLKNAFNITGGQLEVRFSFDYEISGSGSPQRGVGSGQASTPFWYIKRLVLTQNLTLEWDLYQYTKLNESSLPFKITSSRPPLDQAKAATFQNNLLNAGVSKLVTEQLDSMLNSTVEAILNKELLSLAEYNYTYSEGFRKTLTTTFLGNLKQVESSPEGLSVFSINQVKNFNKTECGFVPTHMLDSKYYGGRQTFLSMQMFKSTLKYAMGQGWFDSVLNDANWRSAVFQFYAGDLARALDGIDLLAPDTPLNGTCKFASEVYEDGVLLTSNDNKTLLVEIPYKCELHETARNQSIIDSLVIRLELVVQIVPTREYVNMVIRRANYLVLDTTLGKNVGLKDRGLLNFYLSSLVGQLQGQRTFGSGMHSLEAYRKPGVLVSLNYVLFYDKGLVQ